MERKKYSREFKLEAVNLVKDRGVSIVQAARDLDLNHNDIVECLAIIAARRRCHQDTQTRLNEVRAITDNLPVKLLPSRTIKLITGKPQRFDK